MPIPQLGLKNTLNELQKKKKLSFRKKFFKIFLICCVFAFLIGTIVLVGMFAWVSKEIPDPNKINDRAVAQSTKIYDREGKVLLYEIHGAQKRTLVKIEDIPNSVKWATIALEDQKFYSHHGFDIKGILRAVYVDIIKGEKAQGGSTITQQLVKNSILTSEKKITRKVKELILSYQMEKKFSKDQILQMYLNEIPYGSVAYGVQSASQTYFDKDVKDLTLAESAILASLPQGPSYYSPYGSHVDELMWRKDYCLDQMAKMGYITQEQADEAKKEELVFAKQSQGIIAPHFVMYVKEILTEKYGEKEVEQGGFKVITTLDLTKQQFAEQAIDKYAEQNAKSFNANNASLAAIDPRTGQILAMVGSKDYFKESEPKGCIPGKNCLFEPNVNVAIRDRQPGSSMKPIVYATAFEKGYTPDTILFDVVTAFKTEATDYIPKNFNLREYGPVTMRKALAGSLNIPAVKTLYLAGVDTVLNKTDELDYSTLKDRERYGLSLVLGGGEVKLLDHVAAYGAFATEGEKHLTTSILKIEDKNGKILEEFQDKKKRVWNENTTRQISSILSDNNARAFIFGTNNNLTLPGRPVAAKTGTTNDYRDSWTIGYTPSLVAGVWSGNNDNSEMTKGASSAQVAAPIWHYFMEKALEGTPVESFTDYKRIGETKKPVLSGSIGTEVKVKIDKASGKLATELTPQSYIEEKTFKEYHCILYYVEKDNPWGPVPQNPENDIQFHNWETAVQNWIVKKSQEPPAEGEEKFEVGKPPTENDDLHVLENIPQLTLITPVNNQTINSLQIFAQISVFAKRGISKVDYYIDDQLIDTKRTAPFDLYYTVSSKLTNGFHTLKVNACDDIENCKSASVDINLLSDRPLPQVSLISPKSNSMFYISSFPLKLTAYSSDPYGISKINFYYSINNNTSLITSILSPTEENITINWDAPPAAGTYQLYAEVIGTKGDFVETEKITVSIQ